MRPAILAGVVLVGIPVTGHAQTGPYLATVADPEVKLRAGPTDKYEETATLPKGAQLLVMGEADNGWLKVCDPPGKLYSFSWVQMTLVNFDPNRPLPQSVMVSEDQEATLAAGQVGLAQPLATRLTKVPPGTGLTVIGQKVQFEGKTWYPVFCPANDFRYVPKQALKIERPATTSFTVRDSLPPGLDKEAHSGSGTGGPAASIPGGGGLPAEGGTGKPIVQHPLWAQAEAAEREGRLDDADKLYFQLARVMNEPGGDHDIANLCYSRIHALREKKRSGGTGSNTATPPRPALGEPTRPVGTTNTPQPPKPTGSSPAGTASGGGSSLPPVTDPQDDRAKWIGPGRLTRSALALDGRKTYALETTPGTTAMYVVPSPGVDLERFVGKKVDVYGVRATRSDLSKPFVVATSAEVR